MSRPSRMAECRLLNEEGQDLILEEGKNDQDHKEAGGQNADAAKLMLDIGVIGVEFCRAHYRLGRHWAGILAGYLTFTFLSHTIS